jgi:hypothetical protein
MLFFVAVAISLGSSPAAKALEVIMKEIERADSGAAKEEMTQQVITS